ncbi:MAG: response regulator [Pyrinomonadaceae bacterium]
MKLQIENNSSSNFLADSELVSDISSENGSAEVTEMLRSGIKAAQEGDRSQARTLLLQATEKEPNNENAWLWLASISEYPEELLIFLSNVLKVNPNNERALEWEKSTKSLLSKTFVQRGIDASKDSQMAFAKQSFMQAIVHDDSNEMAWLWLASISESIEEKRSHLQKVLAINPKNETALESLKSVKNEVGKSFLQKAREAAAADDRKTAEKMLKDVFSNAPEMEDAWMLKSFLTDSFSEKLEYFEKILGFNPDHEGAAACLASMKTVLEKTSPPQDGAEKPAKAEVEAEARVEITEEAVEEMLELLEDSGEEPVAEVEAVEVAEETEVEAVAEEPEAVSVEEEVEEFETEKYYSTEEFAESETVEFKYEEYPVSDEMVEESSVHVVEEEAKDHSDPEVVVAESTEAEEAEMASHFSGPEEETAEAEAETGEGNTLDWQLADDVLMEEEAEQMETAEEEVEQEVSEETEMAMEAPEADEAEEESKPKVEMMHCGFCDAENEPQNFICQSCHTMLTLSDLEMLLAHQDADREMLEAAVERMESKNRKKMEAEELKLLGIAHLNLKNLRKGFEYLQDAAHLNQNDVLLNSQVNSLAIRLSEIEEKQNNEESKPKNKTILVVDDSATVRKLISGKLEKCGHEVICAVDGMDALEKINEEIPDLILLDITMPRMDGYQVCKLIRGNEATKEVPVVMISGKDGFFDKVRGRMAGTTGYITKPFGPETLMKTVETYID